MSSFNDSNDGYTPVWAFSSWAEHWFAGVACAIFGNVLVFYTTRIYGRRLAIQRVLQQRDKRLMRQDSLFGEVSVRAMPPLPETILNVVPPQNGRQRLAQSLSNPSLREDDKAEQGSNLSPLSSKLLYRRSADDALPAPPPLDRAASTNDSEIDNGHPATSIRPALVHPNASAGPMEQETKTSDIFRVILLALVIQALQFAGLAIVSLALVTPLTCLFFIWWRVATLETARRKIRKEMSNPKRWSVVLYFASLRRAMTFRFWSIILILVVANAMVIVGGPHRMYVVAVHKVVVLDPLMMVYITIVLFVIMIQGTLGQSKETMERIAKIFRLKRLTDLEPLVLGMNAGLLGGQYLLLVKLLAEIAEASVLLPKESPPGESTFILVIFALVVGVFHLQAWRRGMGLPRTKLFIPVYRFWFVISGMLASILVLREFFESTPADIAIYFVGVFLNLAVLFLMTKNALNAVRKDDFSTVIFLEEDPEHGLDGGGARRPHQPSSKYGRRARAFLMRRSTIPAPPDMRRSRSAPEPVSIVGSRTRAASADSLLAESIDTPKRTRASRHTPKGQSIFDGSDHFFAAHGGNTPHASMTSGGATMGFRKESTDSGWSARRSLHHMPPRSSSRLSSAEVIGDDSSYNSDGYESAGSFHSEPAETRFHEFHQSSSIISPRKSLVTIDYHYTSPTSMIVPKGAFNPWASQGQSFYFDCASVPGNFKVRGPSYLEDGQKIKCDVSRMKLVMGEWLYNPDTPVKNICNDPSHFVQREHIGRRDRPFLFVLNMMVPSVGNAVFTWCRRPNLEPDDVFEKMLDEFIHHPDDDFRHRMFKIIPGVPEGSFIAKKAVGNKPAMLCAKVPTSYYRGDNWFEVCVDCAQSRVAFSVMGAIKGFASGLTLQLGFLLESSTPDTLPERLLGGITIVK